MAQISRWLFIAIATLCVAHVSCAQVTTGTPPFGSFGGGPDVINLGNLNAHITVPILHKAGRGTNFTYDLSYDSSVWYPVTSGSTTTWTPALNFGWRAQTEIATGYISFTTISTYQRVPPCYITQYTNFVYHDPFGIPHSFNGTASHQTNPGSGCTNQVNPLNTISHDGAGYSLYANGNGSAYVVSPQGTVLNVPLNTGSAAASTTDRNGNVITATSGGVFYDTLSSTAPVLTVSGAGTVASPMQFTYTAPSGGNASYQVNYTNYTVATNFGISTIAEYKSTAAVPLVTSIALPDGSQYAFQYEGTPTLPASGACTPYAGTTCVTARVKQVTLSTGGIIKYVYQGGNNGVFSDGSTAGLQRYTPDTGSSYWNYSRVSETGAASITTVTDPTPQANQTILQFQGIYETQRDIYSGAAPAISTFPIPETTLQTTSLQKEIQTCYNTNTSNCTSTAIALPITQQNIVSHLSGATSWAASKTSQVTVTYDSYGNLTGEIDSDFGSGSPGGPLKQTAITYATLNGIQAFRQQVTVKDGSGGVVSQTFYNYGDTVTGTTGTPQHTAPNGSRGNLLSVNYYTHGTSTITRSFTYYDTGMTYVTTDVNNAQTTYTYGSGSCGNSFPTSVAEPVSLTRSMTWNCTGGVQTSVTDENGKSASTSYTTNQHFWRPESATDPTAAVTAFTSSGQTQSESNMPIATGSASDGLLTLDNQGRPILNQKRQQPGGPTFDTTETDYDIAGRPYRVTLPFGANAGQTSSGAPGATSTYDALNRVHVTTDSGTGTVTYTYLQNDVLVAIGPPPPGENSKQRQLEFNGLGQLTSVCEITSLAGSGACGQSTAASGYLTKYTYNPLGQVTGVTQNAQSTAQTRNYAYDLLGRLTSETNPESGTTTYTYDSSSVSGCQISSTGDLMLRTNAAGFYSCYNYDALHRLLSVGHNDGISPYKFFVYDSATVNGITVANAKGRLAEAYTCITTCSPRATDEGFSYTARGEISDVYESTPNSGGFYHSNATYWANGAVNFLTAYNNANAPVYGAGWTLDGEGRVNSNYNTGSNPLSGTTYNASSQPTQVTFSSGDSDSYIYDSQTNRMTQYKFNLPNQSVTGNLTWNANATLQSLTIQDTFNISNTQTCNYVHDDLVRLASVKCPGNQLANPGFEQGATGWSPWSCALLETNSANAHSGNNYFQLTGTSAASCAIVGPTITVASGDQVTFGGWVNLQSGGGGLLGWTISVFDINHNAITSYSTPNPTSTGWTYQTATYTMPSNAAYVYEYAQVWAVTTSTVIFVDDAFLEDTPIWSQTFTYDAFGNLNKAGSMIFNASYSATTNRMTLISGSTPTYDSNGNVTNDLLHTYTWDADGHPLTADGVSLTYDALGRMVEQSRSGAYTQFLYSPTGFKMTVFSGQSVLTDRVPLPGGSRADYDGSAIHIRHGDWLGSSRFTSTLSSRTMYSDGAYGPFGEPYAQAGTSDLSFTGMDQDTAANLYDFPAREYGIQGRWPSPDPAGLGSVVLTNPQSWNRYAYVANNPMSFFDPTGMNRVMGGGSCNADQENCSGGAGIGWGGGTSCSIDGLGANCSTVSVLLNNGSAVQCPDNECTTFAGDQYWYFSAVGNGQGAYYPVEGPGWTFSTEAEALAAGALWAAAGTADNGNENCGMTYQNGNGEYSFTGSLEGQHASCQPLNANSLIPSAATADGGYHSHPNDPNYLHERFSGQPGDYPNGPGGDVGWSNSQGLPLSLGSPWGRVIIYYPGPNCQVFVTGTPAGTGTTISTCP